MQIELCESHNLFDLLYFSQKVVSLQGIAKGGIMEDIQAIKQRFEIIGNTASLNRAIDVAIQVAPTDLSVLITGESGAGKEIFPRIIHAYSVRKHAPYIAVNCGAIPEGTIDSELFGHEKGAFTGAVSDRKGYFEVTDGGTIFLDEVGELPLATQARLLRVLESGEFIRVGSSKVQKTNVRVIAATNLNIPDAVRNGKFREDLFYRLNTIPIMVPPLRERQGVPEVCGGFRGALPDARRASDGGRGAGVEGVPVARECAAVEECDGAGLHHRAGAVGGCADAEEVSAGR